MKNAELYRSTLDWIKENPHMWNQAQWTDEKFRHCFGGWLLIKAGIWNGSFGYKPLGIEDNCHGRKSDLLQELLGLDIYDLFDIIKYKNTIEDLENFYNEYA